MASHTIHNPAGRWGRQPLAALGRVTAGALLGIAVLLVLYQVVILRAPRLQFAIFILLPLLGLAVSASGWRWSPLGGAGVAALFVGLGGQRLVRALLTPSNVVPFTLTAMLVALCVIALVAGIGATVQNIRNAPDQRRAPRLLGYGLAVVAALVAGAVAVAALPRPGNAAGINPALLTTLPAVTLDAYAGGELRVGVNETVALRLENTDAIAHSFDVDELNVHAPMPDRTTSLALFRPTEPGTYTFYCAPHYNKATGQGMHGTLIVE